MPRFAGAWTSSGIDFISLVNAIVMAGTGTIASTARA
ncbi:hypothetical protein GGI59_005854 [Rhizobium lentis]|uniref:Uncharacterized protein n=1 Tax=Rhizobium lentis TaxID=1138194 RepID=A0A7W9CY27_9HYPH|nr:hypothetical protein [Rhizobium lentis]MBB5553511.1 hypothetical protein [Rhizobium lentis]MBB5564147.1 hypothetical protein [Rhizobium lentis]